MGGFSDVTNPIPDRTSKLVFQKKCCHCYFLRHGEMLGAREGIYFIQHLWDKLLRYCNKFHVNCFWYFFPLEIWTAWEANKWYLYYKNELFLISFWKIYNFQTASKLGCCIIKHLTFVQLKLLTHAFIAPPSNYYSATADLTIFSISYK